MVAVVVLLSVTLAADSAQDETGERLSQAWYLPPINNSMVIVTFCFCYCSMIATTLKMIHFGYHNLVNFTIYASLTKAKGLGLSGKYSSAQFTKYS